MLAFSVQLYFFRRNHDFFAAAGNEIAFIGSSHGMLPQL